MLASIDSAHLVLRILRNAYQKGERRITPQKVVERLIELEEKINPSQKKRKRRLERGLLKHLLRNVQHTLSVLPYVEPVGRRTRKGRNQFSWPPKFNPEQVYLLADEFNKIDLEAEETELDRKAVEERKFRKEVLNPLFRKHFDPLLAKASPLKTN